MIHYIVELLALVSSLAILTAMIIISIANVREISCILFCIMALSRKLSISITLLIIFHISVISVLTVDLFNYKNKSMLTSYLVCIVLSYTIIKLAIFKAIPSSRNLITIIERF